MPYFWGIALDILKIKAILNGRLKFDDGGKRNFGSINEII